MLLKAAAGALRRSRMDLARRSFATHGVGETKSREGGAPRFYKKVTVHPALHEVRGARGGGGCAAQRVAHGGG